MDKACKLEYIPPKFNNTGNLYAEIPKIVIAKNSS